MPWVLLIRGLSLRETQASTTTTRRGNWWLQDSTILRKLLADRFPMDFVWISQTWKFLSFRRVSLSFLGSWNVNCTLSRIYFWGHFVQSLWRSLCKLSDETGRRKQNKLWRSVAVGLIFKDRCTGIGYHNESYLIWLLVYTDSEITEKWSHILPPLDLEFRKRHTKIRHARLLSKDGFCYNY